MIGSFIGLPCHLEQLRSIDCQRVQFALGEDRGGASFALNHSQFAEDLSGTEFAQGLQLPVFFFSNFGAAGNYEVGAIRGAVLLEYVFTV